MTSTPPALPIVSLPAVSPPASPAVSPPAPPAVSPPAPPAVSPPAPPAVSPPAPPAVSPAVSPPAPPAVSPPAPPAVSSPAPPPAPPAVSSPAPPPAPPAVSPFAPWQALRAANRWLLARLSRVTSSGQFITEIDGLRFVAIFSVLMFHAHGHFFVTDPSLPRPPWTGEASVAATVSYVIQTGWFGVQLFFVISGFILAMPFAEHHLLGKPRPRIGKYFLRRLTRLEPPYLISLLLILWLWVSFHHKDLRGLLPHLAAHATYLHNAIYGHISAPGFVAINHVAWSLEVEVQFYILAPALCLVFAIRDRWLRRAVVAGGIAAATWVTHRYWSPMLTMTLAGQIRYFLIGFLLADLYLVEWRSAPPKGEVWDLLGTAAWTVGPFLLPHRRATEVLMPVVLLVAYVGAFRGRLLNRFFAAPWIAAIGGMCYTIYLYHVHMIWMTKVWFVRHVFGPVRYGVWPWNLLQLLAVCLGVVALCSVGFVLFEKPFMRRRWPSELVTATRRGAGAIARLAARARARRPAAAPTAGVTAAAATVTADDPGSAP